MKSATARYENSYLGAKELLRGGRQENYAIPPVVLEKGWIGRFDTRLAWIVTNHRSRSFLHRTQRFHLNPKFVGHASLAATMASGDVSVAWSFVRDSRVLGSVFA